MLVYLRDGITRRVAVASVLDFIVLGVSFLFVVVFVVVVVVVVVTVGGIVSLLLLLLLLLITYNKKNNRYPDFRLI